MRTKICFGILAATAMATTPIVAAAEPAGPGPAPSLSLSSASNARVAGSSRHGSQLSGAELAAAIAALAVGAGAIILAATDSNNKRPTSP